MAELVRLEVTDGVAVVTLNRPDKLNAFADDMRDQLVAVLDRVAGDRAARVMVVTGAGRAFCAGGDVHHMAGLKKRDAGFDELEPLLAAGRAVVTRIAALPIPTIAAVNGVAAGAGANLALACDLRLASDQASFGETFARIGLHPDWGGTYFLTRAIGVARALELCWTGDVVDANEALRIGLVNHVYPQAEFPQAWMAFARRLASGPQTSLRAAKRTLGAAMERTLDQCIAAEVEAQRACWESADTAEGLSAFAEKRTAVFAAEPVEAGPLSRAARFFE